MAQRTITPIKFVHLTKKNRRITLKFCKDNTGEYSVMLHTKRLIDFRKRHILEANLFLGIESFEAIADIINLLREDPEYRKMTNAERAQCVKDRFSAITNCEH